MNRKSWNYFCSFGAELDGQVKWKGTQKWTESGSAQGKENKAGHIFHCSYVLEPSCELLGSSNGAPDFLANEACVYSCQALYRHCRKTGQRASTSAGSRMRFHWVRVQAYCCAHIYSRAASTCNRYWINVMKELGPLKRNVNWSST